MAGIGGMVQHSSATEPVARVDVGPDGRPIQVGEDAQVALLRCQVHARVTCRENDAALSVM